MKKEQAVLISTLLEEWSGSSIYEMRSLETVSGFLPRFHQWTNGKKTVSGYEVIRLDTHTGYYFLLIDWHRNENYYLVIYSQDKSTTLAELHQIEELDGIPHFIWRYNPLKRDGKNDIRKAYFKSTFGSLLIQIELPATVMDIEPFFTRLFKLCQHRLQADRIVNVFDFE